MIIRLLSFSSDINSAGAREVLPLLQHAVTRAVGDAAGNALLEEQDLRDPEGKRTAARLRSGRGAPAMAWLTALPARHGRTTIGDTSFKTAMRHHLGMRVSSPVDMPPCTCKNATELSGAYPDHPLICTLTNKTTSMRHDAMRSCLRHLTSMVGAPSSEEPPYRGVTRPNRRDPGEHRADVLAILPGGRHVMVDVTVVHPLGVKRVTGAAKADASAAKFAEARKVGEWQQFSDHAAYEFVPFGIETYGTLGPQAQKFLSELGDVAAMSGRVSKSRFMMNAYRAISCTLQKHNAWAYANSLTAIARKCGDNFMPGYDVPVDVL